MKKIMFVLGFMMSIAVTSAFASEVKVSSKVLEAFKKEFSTAQEVNWAAGDNYYRAAFKYNEQNIFAYYNTDGELKAVTRYISSLQLPINLLVDLKNDFSKYWVSDLFELNNGEGTHYYITLEDADTVIKMVSSNSGEWRTLSKKRKI